MWVNEPTCFQYFYILRDIMIIRITQVVVLQPLKIGHIVNSPKLPQNSGNHSNDPKEVRRGNQRPNNRKEQNKTKQNEQVNRKQIINWKT